MIKNMLKEGKRATPTWLLTVDIAGVYRWWWKMITKCSFQPALRPSSVEEEDSLFPSFNIFFIISPFQVFLLYSYGRVKYNTWIIKEEINNRIMTRTKVFSVNLNLTHWTWVFILLKYPVSLGLQLANLTFTLFILKIHVKSLNAHIESQTWHFLTGYFLLSSFGRFW